MKIFQGSANKKINKWITELQNGDKLTRYDAVKALDELKWQPTLDEIGATYWCQKNKLEPCLEIGTPAVAPLMAYISDPRNSALRRKAALILGELGDSKAVPVLITALTDENKYLREAAAKALGQIADPQAKSSLIIALIDEYLPVRQQAARALDSIGWKPDQEKIGATYWMVKFLFDRDASGQERQSAGETLGRLNWQPDQNEVGAAFWIARGNFKQCAAMGPAAVLPLFMKLQDANQGVRDAAANALVEMGKPAAEILGTALEDYFIYSYTDASSLTLRIAAARVLGRIGDPIGIKPLLEYFNKIERTLDHKQAAASALAMIGRPAVKPLIKALEEDLIQDLQGVAWALEKIGDPEAILPLITFISKGYTNQAHERSAASQALCNLTGQDFGEDANQWEIWWKEQGHD